MKTYSELITNEEETNGVYQDEYQTVEVPQDQEDKVVTKFSIGEEYQTKIENSLSKLESAIEAIINTQVRLKLDKCDCGIKLVSNDIDINCNLFKSVSLESNCVCDFEKDSNTGHSITKFIFQALVTSAGSQQSIPLESSEYIFDFDLNDWLIIKK